MVRKVRKELQRRQIKRKDVILELQCHEDRKGINVSELITTITNEHNGKQAIDLYPHYKQKRCELNQQQWVLSLDEGAHYSMTCR